LAAWVIVFIKNFSIGTVLELDHITSTMTQTW